MGLYYLLGISVVYGSSAAAHLTQGSVVPRPSQPLLTVQITVPAYGAGPCAALLRD